MDSDVKKIRGPKYNSFVGRDRPSLLQTVSSSTPSQLGAIVVGSAVYEVFMGLPECQSLNAVMASVKRKQDNFKLAGALKCLRTMMQAECENEPPFMDMSLLMNNFHMQLFLSKCPLRILYSTMFKTFIPIVKSFLVDKLFKFTHKNRLYKALPKIPPDNRLPAIINALGPMDQLSEKYPHLARMKLEMVHNIMDFAVRYCLDWICETLIVQCDEMGKVQYYCPSASKFSKKNGAAVIQQDVKLIQESKLNCTQAKKKCNDIPNTDNTYWETQTLTNSSSTNSSNIDDLKNEFTSKRMKLEVTESKEDKRFPISKTPSSSSTADKQSSQTGNSSQPSTENCYDNSVNLGVPPSIPPVFPFIHDDWSDMLNMALTDPNLAPHYKTMIHCLVASNRDMKSMIVMMRAQPS